MEPKEKVKFLYEGKKVKLKSLREVEDKHPRIVGDMRKFFGDWVTINTIPNILNNQLFTIKEGGFNYHVDWIADFHFISLPQELFEI